MIKDSVDASPTKKFFIDNFTRDLTLEDVVLDLIDNSIDSYIRTNNVELTFNSLLDDSNKPDDKAMGQIDITISKDMFNITDNCGGIDIEHAKKEVFRFGRTSDEYSGALGIYGIGLKRAIFKIGKKITVKSKTSKNGFEVEIDVDKCLKDYDKTI